MRQGSSTLTISLPSNWTKRYALEGGEELDIEDKGNELIISCSRQQKGPGIHLYVSELQKLINRSILNAYQAGYDSIVVHKKDSSYDPTRVVNELFGFEIVSQTESTFVLKDIIETSPKEFDNLLRRLFLLIKTTIEEGEHALQSGHVDTLQTLIAKDVEINKLCNVCLRYIAKNDYTEDPKRSYSMFVVISRLEEIADYYKQLFRTALSGYIQFGRAHV